MGTPATGDAVQQAAVAVEPRVVWSRNGEDFFHDAETLDELIDHEGGPDEFKVGQIVHAGEVQEHGTDWVDAGDVIEQIGNRAYDEASEHAEDFPNVTTEATAELQAFLEAWQAKHCKATFYRVVNVREHIITADDLAPTPPSAQGGGT